jgi:peptide-methionine (S)-S-oxide reductase
MSGHAEVVQVTFDPAKVSYEKLLSTWLNHDPTVTDRSSCDSGTQYRPAIFYYGEEQKRLPRRFKANGRSAKLFR